MGESVEPRGGDIGGGGGPLVPQAWRRLGDGNRADVPAADGQPAVCRLQVALDARRAAHLCKHHAHGRQGLHEGGFAGVQVVQAPRIGAAVRSPEVTRALDTVRRRQGLRIAALAAAASPKPCTNTARIKPIKQEFPSPVTKKFAEQRIGELEGDCTPVV